jgi:hypothetical protein
MSLLIVSLLAGGCKDETESKQVSPKEQVPEKTKTKAWGNAFNGLALSIEPTQSSYRLGEPIKVTALTKNVRNEKGRLTSISGPAYSYRVCLFDMEGRPVQLSIHGEGVASMIIRGGPEVASFSWKVLEPGDTFSETLWIDRWLNITKEGTYTLVVMRQTESWKRGFFISNAVKIKITKD